MNIRRLVHRVGRRYPQSEQAPTRAGKRNGQVYHMAARGRAQCDTDSVANSHTNIPLAPASAHSTVSLAPANAHSTVSLAPHAAAKQQQRRLLAAGWRQQPRHWQRWLQQPKRWLLTKKKEAWIAVATLHQSRNPPRPPRAGKCHTRADKRIVRRPTRHRQRRKRTHTG